MVQWRKVGVNPQLDAQSTHFELPQMWDPRYEHDGVPGRMREQRLRSVAEALLVLTCQQWTDTVAHCYALMSLQMKISSVGTTWWRWRRRTREP